MTIVPILKSILQAVPIVFAVLAVIFIIVNPQKNILKVVKDNLRRIGIKTVCLVIVSALIFGVLSTAASYLEGKQKASAIVGLNYLQASSGLNPNNTKFTVSELVDDGIMEGILEKGGFTNITAEELKDCFYVKPLGGSTSVSLEQPYIATEYYVEFEKSKRLSSVDSKKMLALYAETLQEWFAESYSRKTNLLEVDFSELDTADYMDIDVVLEARATELWRYVNNCSQENSTFYSPSTGESFRTLSQKILNYKEVAIENYRAFVLKNGLSKDEDAYIGKMNYENRLLDMDYKKNLATYKINLDVVDMYERDMATIVLVPTRDESGEFYMSRTKIGVDDFSNDADKAADTAASLAKNISDNNYKITQLLGTQDGNLYGEEAERMIEILKSDLKSLAETAMITVNEYDAQNQDGYIAVALSEDGVMLMSYVKKLVKNSMVFLLTLVLMLSMKPYKSRKRVRA